MIAPPVLVIRGRGTAAVRWVARVLSACRAGLPAARAARLADLAAELDAMERRALAALVRRQPYEVHA